MHVGFIMDGNGRWATRQGLTRLDGHTKGAEVAQQILEECIDAKVAYATFYTLSLQNWKRDNKEIEHLFQLANTFFDKIRAMLLAKNARFQFVGNLHHLPEKTRARVASLQEETKAATGTVVSTCLSYGGREEILDIFRSIKEPLDTYTVKSISALFPLPDVDLVIRTSGEYRISNFLLWHSAYAEYYFTPTLWPDFTVAEMHKAIAEFNGRNRRYGGYGSNEDLTESVEYMFEYLSEMCSEYKAVVDLRPMYAKMATDGAAITVDPSKPEPTRADYKQFAHSSEGAASLFTLIYDVVMAAPLEEQCRILRLLAADFSVEPLESVLGKESKVVRFYNDTTPTEKRMFASMYECAALQRESMEPMVQFIYRALSAFYASKIFFNDAVNMDHHLLCCMGAVVAYDLFESSEPTYVTQDTYRIVTNAVHQLLKEKVESSVKGKATFLALSLILNRFDGPVPVPATRGQAYHYLAEGF